MPVKNTRLKNNLHDQLGNVALGLRVEFFVGEHEAAVGQIDHDQAAALVVAEVEQDLAVVERGACGRQVWQLVTQGFAGVLALEDRLDDGPGGDAACAIQLEPVVPRLAALLHDAGDRVLLADGNADRGERCGDLGVGGGVETLLHNLCSLWRLGRPV